jgi:hypothetical protein
MKMQEGEGTGIFFVEIAFASVFLRICIKDKWIFVNAIEKIVESNGVEK